MATHPSFLAWKVPWTEELGGLQSMGSQRVRHDCRNNTCTQHMFNQLCKQLCKSYVLLNGFIYTDKQEQQHVYMKMITCYQSCLLQSPEVASLADKIWSVISKCITFEAF